MNIFDDEKMMNRGERAAAIYDLLIKYGYPEKSAMYACHKRVSDDDKAITIVDVKNLIDYIEEVGLNDDVTHTRISSLIYHWSKHLDKFKKYIHLLEDIGLDPNVYFIRRYTSMCKADPDKLEQLIDVCKKHGYDIRVLIENCQGLVCEPQIETIDNFEKFVNDAVSKYGTKNSITINPKQLLERCSTLGLATIDQLESMLDAISKIKNTENKKIIDPIKVLAIYSSCLVGGNADALEKVAQTLREKGHDNAKIFALNKKNLNVSSFEDFLNAYNEIEGMLNDSNNVKTLYSVDSMLVSKANIESIKSAYNCLSDRYDRAKVVDFLTNNTMYMYKSNFGKLDRQINRITTLGVEKTQAMDLIVESKDPIKIPSSKRFDKVVDILKNKCNMSNDEILDGVKEDYTSLEKKAKASLGSIKNMARAKKIVNRVTNHIINKYNTPILVKTNSVSVTKQLSNSKMDKLIQDLINARSNGDKARELMEQFLKEDDER